jgi:hypothetical protein
MKAISILIAALAVFSLSACENSIDEGVDFGEKTFLSFSLSFPAHRDSRVAAIDNTDVSTIDVFVLNDNGSMERLGGYTRLEGSNDFTTVVAGGCIVCELNTRIETLSGAKRVYLGVNVPEDTFDGFLGNEKELLTKIHSLYLHERTSDESILFSDPLSIALREDAVGSLAVNDDDFGIDYGDKAEINIEVGIDPWNNEEVTITL